MNRKKFLTKLETVFQSVFSAWEKTNLIPGVRERVEVSLIRIAISVLNARDRRFAIKQASEGLPELHRMFKFRTGYPLNLENPRSFNEKIQWRKLHDRNPLFPILSDKLRAKDWIREKIGEDRTVPTLFYTTSALELPLGIEKETLILKTTHDSGGQFVVTPELNRSRGEIIRGISKFLFRDFGVKQFEWAYQEVDRRIIAEPLLGSGHDALPDDVRFHLFGGRLQYIQYQTGIYRNGEIHVDGTVLISPDWAQLSVMRPYDKLLDLPPRPREFERMIEIANILAEGFDYLRVDFFVISGEFHVSEATIYASGGFQRFDPIDYDYELGQLWELPDQAIDNIPGTDELGRE